MSENEITEAKSPEAVYKPIVLPFIDSKNPEVLIFDTATIRRLRDEYAILGVLIGTLAQYPQQNVFLSVPLKLMVWEVVWLLEKDVCVLVDWLKYCNLKKDAMHGEYKNKNLIALDNGNKDNQSDFLITRNDFGKENDWELIEQCKISLQSYIDQYLSSPTCKTNVRQFISNYHKYKHLKNKGCFISPGLKFGGDLVIYPGDPLRYHSYSIIKFDFVDVNEIIVGGRLATGVKKNMVIMASGNDKELNREKFDVIHELFSDPTITAFSIEWAGFG
ncbi:putative tRNA-splicing endonuclease subunit sen34 [Spathaspora sp. JA1]|nr:putative tRNA-splicing endonuclease subunit sen34 [Spathaspora sp. JA1]